MIKLEEIKHFYRSPEKEMGLMILKEYLQYKILDWLFSSKWAQKLVFTGGTAIRIVYGGDRFSEDIDLDTNNLGLDEFGEIVEMIKRNFKREGIEVESKNVNKGVMWSYLRFPKIMIENGLSPNENEKLLIQLDMDKIKEWGKTELKIINKFGVFEEVKIYNKETLIKLKVEALIGRKRPKGRDIYDIVYLVADGKLEKEVKEKLMIFCNDNDLESLAKDVEPFVINKDKLKVVYKFREWVEQN